MSTLSEKNVRTVTIAALAAIILLYLGQGVIYWIRLNQIDASKINLEFLNEQCDELNCTATWRFQPTGKFLLLGHVLRTHQVHLENSNENLIPVSKIRGTSADSWAGLRVYEVEPNKTYILEAEKYKSIRMGYFIGVLPRSSNHEGLLSIPDIGPTVSTISALLGIFILFVMFGSAYLGQNSKASSRSHEHQIFYAIAIAACFAVASSFISMGVLDSLLIEGDLRNKILRFSLMCAIMIPVAAQFNWLKSPHTLIKIFFTIALIIGVGLLFWSKVRGGISWALIVTTFTLIGTLSLIRLKKTLPAIALSFSLFDALKIFGLIEITDYPPVYLSNISIMSSMILFAGDLGGYATISMAGLAYRRFKRDLVLMSIQNVFDSSIRENTSDTIAELRSVLPDIANLVGAGQVAVTINLPLGRPVTQTYDVNTNNTRVFDDGKIPGSVTLRALLYGDEVIFESFSDYAHRLRIAKNPTFEDSSYFCAIPLRVNKSIIGTIILTKFNDQFIRKKLENPSLSFLSEEKETIYLVVERLSQSLSKLMVQDYNSSVALSKSLQISIHKIIASSSSATDFLWRFVATLANVCNVGVMLHEKFDNRGVALAQSGIQPHGWEVFLANPFNLSIDAKQAYGPTVVAFRDGKSSYVKNVSEVSDRFHPQTQQILASMKVQSLAAIPLKSAERSFVITIMTTSDQSPADPTITSVIESTEALFVAAVEVMSQKTSVLALGQLASRLIGDDEVREKILDAAKSRDLPTTIGSPRVSFLLLFDLIGSSDLSTDTETKARAYGDFYDAVNRKSQEVLGGLIRKTIGDAVIVTWDGTDILLTRQVDLLQKLEYVADYADKVAKSIGCKGARALLHHGRYFLGLVGTHTFGQIDVIGTGIDEVCKMEGVMKTIKIESQRITLAISETAANELPSISTERYLDHGYTDISGQCDQKFSIKYGKVISITEEDQVHHVA